MKKKIVKIMATIGVFAALLCVGSIMAYFSDYDDAVNKFTIGEVTIDLTEPSWVPENGEELWPNKTVEKDPTVTNTGINNAWIYTQIKIPVKNVITANDDGTLTKTDANGNGVAQMTQLFELNNSETKNGVDDVDAGWELIETTTETHDGTAYNVYTYAYKKVVPGTRDEETQAGRTTTPLFKTVTFANIIEEQIAVGWSEYMDVNAYAIQADGLELDSLSGTAFSSADYAKAWVIYSNQNDTMITVDKTASIN
ncbi:MAG: Camelysin metallo-endopeptidase [Lachnospiraceae bacterium]|nr:Camelysin metallo-endopeptidase [Lachnospiraceae bacterium]